MLPIEEIPAVNWQELARAVDENPAGVLAACSSPDAKQVSVDLGRLLDASKKSLPDKYAPVVIWTLSDQRRTMLIPPGHWLLIQDSATFRATLIFEGEHRPQHVQSIPTRAGHVACFAPRQPAGDARLELERHAPAEPLVKARVRYLAREPKVNLHGGKMDLSLSRDIVASRREIKGGAKADHALQQPIVLLTNGIGGMTRLCVDFGAIKSKYDCLLGANLHPRLPVDRHVFAKRARVWVNARGFISPLDLRNLVSFEPGPPAVWHFTANAGDSRTVQIRITAAMLPGRNTTVLRLERPAVAASGE